MCVCEALKYGPAIALYDPEVHYIPFHTSSPLLSMKKPKCSYYKEIGVRMRKDGSH